jgi:hypothetical protein
LKHQVTWETKGMLETLGHVRLRVQPRLDQTTAEARQEWSSLLERLPSAQAMEDGLIEVSPETLAQMVSKASRFEQILTSSSTPDQQPR